MPCGRPGWAASLLGLENPGADWVKLEVLADTRTLLPDPVATLEATRVLVKEGFQVLCYTSDDPVMARRLKEAGATSVMPAGSPIGSGQGVLNPNNIRIILEDLKNGDPAYPVIVDAGVGTASDVTIAMELGCDGVLLNTGIAGAADPLRMAHAMRLAVESGWLAAGAGRIPRKLYATASSPTQGVIGQRVRIASVACYDQRGLKPKCHRKWRLVTEPEAVRLSAHSCVDLTSVDERIPLKR